MLVVNWVFSSTAKAGNAPPARAAEKTRAGKSFFIDFLLALRTGPMNSLFSVGFPMGLATACGEPGKNGAPRATMRTSVAFS
jgi:hypothetical protein